LIVGTEAAPRQWSDGKEHKLLVFKVVTSSIKRRHDSAWWWAIMAMVLALQQMERQRATQATASTLLQQHSRKKNGTTKPKTWCRSAGACQNFSCRPQGSTVCSGTTSGAASGAASSDTTSDATRTMVKTTDFCAFLASFWSSAALPDFPSIATMRSHVSII